MGQHLFDFPPEGAPHKVILLADRRPAEPSQDASHKSLLLGVMNRERKESYAKAWIAVVKLWRKDPGSSVLPIAIGATSANHLRCGGLR